MSHAVLRAVHVVTHRIQAAFSELVPTKDGIKAVRCSQAAHLPLFDELIYPPKST